MADEQEGLGARLRAGRLAAGLSQEELAERAGVSIRAISNLERGRVRWPYPDTVHRLADALNLRGEARDGFIGAAARRLASVSSAASDASGNRDEGRTARRVVPRQLPAPVPGFSGRDTELAVLSQMLRQPGATAVITAIGGMAGVGKTALAVHWSHQVAAEFPDGQLFVNLRGFDPTGRPMAAADAVRALLEALGLRPDELPGTAEAQQGLYRSLLAGKRMLLVLDNARDEAQVRPLLPGSLTCRVLVTSRNQLTGLIATDAVHPLALDVLTDPEARHLLQQRAGADLLAAAPAAVTQIIRACAGLPLALCITAARAMLRPDLSPAELAADLAAHRGLGAFAGEADPAANVRAVFSWSYQHLDAGPARAFRLMGLHPGPDIDRYALAALGGLTAEQAGIMLDLLVQACLIQPAGPGRYGMHDLLRDYAAELAAASSAGDNHASLTRLLDYYLFTAAMAMDVAFPAERHRRPRISAPEPPIRALTTEADALAWLDAERANLLAVTVHGAEGGWPSHTIQLAATLARYLDTGAHFPEAITIHTSARAAAGRIRDRAAEAGALHSLGGVDLHQGRHEQAARHFRQAVAMCQEAGDRAGQARGFANLGLAEFLQGRTLAGIGHFQQALNLHRETGDRIGQTRALGNLGWACLRQGRYQEAVDYLQESLGLCRDTGDRGGEARALANLAEVGMRLGNDREAAGHFRRALALFHHLGDRISEADTLANVAVIELREGRHEQAMRHLRQALALFRATGDLSRQALALNGLGDVLFAAGRPADARAEYAAALRVADQAGEKYEQARAYAGLASTCQASGAAAQARRHWRDALARYAEIGAPEAEHVRVQLAAMDGAGRGQVPGNGRSGRPRQRRGT
jgi:tetratricopeptide (TPR) repeat protein/transcriptional regulator with XRE-family HTH domain